MRASRYLCGTYAQNSAEAHTLHECTVRVSMLFSVAEFVANFVVLLTLSSYTDLSASAAHCFGVRITALTSSCPPLGVGTASRPDTLQCCQWSMFCTEKFQTRLCNLIALAQCTLLVNSPKTSCRGKSRVAVEMLTAGKALNLEAKFPWNTAMEQQARLQLLRQAPYCPAAAAKSYIPFGAIVKISDGTALHDIK